MEISADQIAHYRENGYLLLPACFRPAEIERLKAELPVVFAEDSPRRVFEKDGTTVRSLYGAHLTNRLFAALARDARLVQPSRTLIGDDVYVHQLKINAKPRFGGDVWNWHQDFIFWRNEDGIREPHLTTAVLFLDEVTEFNGPMILISGSHASGVIETEALDGKPRGYEESPEWISNLTATIKYSIDHDAVTALARTRRLVAPKGPSGTVLFFHGNIVHASSPNMSPFDRALALITYNSVANAPLCTERSRPDFLCGRDHVPLSIERAAELR